MKIQRPSYEIWLQKPGELGIYQQIERAGRVCYKSENNTTVNSAKPFVDRMVQSEHFAMLEHGTVYLVCKHGELPLYTHNKFSRLNTLDGKDYITTNLRVLAENKAMDDLKYLSNYEEGKHELRITVHFTTLLPKAMDLLDTLPHKIQLSLHSHESNAKGELASYMNEVMTFSTQAAEKGTCIVLRLWNQGGKDQENEEVMEHIEKFVPKPWKYRKQTFPHILSVSRSNSSALNCLFFLVCFGQKWQLRLHVLVISM